MKSVVLIIAALAVVARAQIPSLGFCPEYLPMPGFDMERFSGIWYEAERYFQLTEVASRCVMSNYTRGPDGKFHVTNEVTSRFTGIKRVLEGEIRKPASKSEEGKLHVKYTTVPLIPLETQYNVLETDYDNYAVLWSCSGVGPVHAQNAWIMVRNRNAGTDILQKAYAVLDKYKISKIFFVKTNHDDCAYLDVLAAEANAHRSTEPPKIAEEAEEEEESPQPLRKSADAVRPITPDAPEAIIQSRKTEEKKKPVEPIVEVPQPVVASAEESVKSVPEVIMKIADQAKEKEEAKAAEPVKEPAKEPIKEETPANEPKETAPIAAEEKKPQQLIVEEQIEIVKP